VILLYSVIAIASGRLSALFALLFPSLFRRLLSNYPDVFLSFTNYYINLDVKGSETLLFYHAHDITVLQSS